MSVRASVKRKLLAFSIVLFMAILIAGSAAYLVSVKNIINSSKTGELRQLLELERVKLETSMNSKISLALKMAESPAIRQYFAAPEDSVLEKDALEEIAVYRKAFDGNTIFWVNDKDKKFYFDSAYAFTVNPGAPENYWYLLTLNETEKYNININYNPDINKTNIWINVPVLDEKNKPIGMLGTGIDLTAFIESIYNNYSEDATLYFFNNIGEITAAREANLAANKVLIYKQLGRNGEKILRFTETLSEGHVQSFIAHEGAVSVGTVPVLGWYIAVIQPLDMKDYIKTDIIATFMAAIAVIALLFIVFNVLI